MTRKSAPFPACPVADAKPAKERLRLAAARAFADKGYGGASVRQICDAAQTSSNMIHHYFGSKKGLFDDILRGYSDSVFVVPMRIISEPARNQENLIARLEIFMSETFVALLAQPDVLRMVIREQAIFEIFATYNELLVQWFEAAKSDGIVRAELDIAMLTGLILDRLGNQVLYAQWIDTTSGHNILTDAKYRKRWLAANVDLILNGILVK